MDKRIFPEDCIGTVFRVTPEGCEYGLRRNFLGQTLEENWMLVAVNKNLSWPEELLEEPDATFEAIHNLTFLIKDRTYKVHNVLGKDFTRFFEPIENEIK